MAELLITAAVALPLCATFGVFAWKAWHGQWLRFIAGNADVRNDELGSPKQRRLGRGAAVIALVACAILLSVPIVDAIQLVGGSARGMLALQFALGFACVALGGLLVYRFSRDSLAESGASKSDKRTAAAQAIVLVLALGSVIAVCAFAVVCTGAA